MCIGIEHRTMRFFGAAATTGHLAVEALYTQRDGRQRAVALGTVRGGGA